MLDRSSLGAHEPAIQSFGKDIDKAILQQFMNYFLRMSGMFSLTPWTGMKSPEPCWSSGWRTRTISSSSSLLKVLKRSTAMKKIVIESVSLRSTSDPSLHFTLQTFTFYSYTLCTLHMYIHYYMDSRFVNIHKWKAVKNKS